MSSYTEQVRKRIEHLPNNEIISASELYNLCFQNLPEITYYKILERLTKQQELVHLTKGLYYRPEKKEGEINTISTECIIDYYVNDDRGIVIGERLFFEKGLIPNASHKIEVISNYMKEEKKRIENVEVKKTNILLNVNTVPVIETLEILQNYNKVDNIDKNRFLSYMRKFSEQYSDEYARYVIENRKYKKSTIAFLERILTWYGVENSLFDYLSSLSEYKIPTMDELKAPIPHKLKECLKVYVDKLQKIYTDSMDKVLLYGSYARGDYDETSDVDVMILLKLPDLDIKKYRHQLSELTYDFNDRYDLDIKPIAKNTEEFIKWVDAYPFYANVQKDGVELFASA